MTGPSWSVTRSPGLIRSRSRCATVPPKESPRLTIAGWRPVVEAVQLGWTEDASQIHAGVRHTPRVSASG